MNKRLLLALAVLALLASPFAYHAAVSDSRPDTLRISGNIEISDVDVAFRLPGRVAERLVSEGQSVRAGQLVARLDDAELRHELELRRAQLGMARARLAELTAGYRTEEVAEARAALNRVRAEAARAQIEYDRQRELLAKEVISAREFESAEAAHRTTAAQVEERGQRLRLLERGPRREQIDQAREGVRQAEEAVALAETRLSWAILTSPIAGLVLADHVEPGEQVVAGRPVVTVGDLSAVWLRGYVDETDLGRVKAGQSARVTADTYPGRIYPGTVTFVASEAEFTPKSVQTPKERVKLVYRIKVDVANPEAELKPGMPADAEIQRTGE